MESSAETAPISPSPTLSSPCAGCKFLRRKCQSTCIFAPYFPGNQPQKFVDVHRVFGASNLTKILNDLLPDQREDAVMSLVYEAQMRLRDPVYGCVRVILVLEDQLQRLKFDLSCAWGELARTEVAAGVRRVGAEELGFPDWLQEQRRMVMMMMMMVGGTGGGDDSGFGGSVNASDVEIGALGEQVGVVGDDDDGRRLRGLEDYFYSQGSG